LDVVCNKKEGNMPHVDFESGERSPRLSSRRPAPVRYVPPLQYLLGVLRYLWPIPGLFRYAAVLLREDVEEVLSRPDIFKVPFAGEMTRLADGSWPGTPFILGTDDKSAHDEQLVRLMHVFRLDDVETVGEIARRHASRTVGAATGGELDAIEKLITDVPLDICVEYLGVPVGDRRSFTEALVCLSGHLFGPPPIVQKPHVDAMADIVREVVDDAIRAARRVPPKPTTVMGRLMREESRDTEVRAFLLGLIVGFVPTTTIAGGHILEMMLRTGGMLRMTRAAALSGDETLLGQCLFEALRYKPINYGPFRVCEKDYVVAANSWRRKRIREGTFVLACTMSAMFDRSRVRQPYVFTPGRPAADRLQFGLGLHWCVGAFIAQAQLVQTFKPLVMQPGLERAQGCAGRLQRWPKSIFPRHLVVRIPGKSS
jgi:cytochrome P450